ncbi:MAG: cell division protein FtsA [Dysgonamonadaceae bacterium]|jgi:cell division protein FtsA|nr:cell division protein FtsA [Dysgonamonadaceae bacterium]
MHKEIIATIDIGSSKIIAAAGEKDEKGVIRILALETEPIKTSVRRGRIYNVGEVSQKITSLLTRLNRDLKEEIVKIYVGVGGQSLMTETHSVVEETEGAIVDEQLLQSLREKCENYQPDFSEVLDIVSPEYFINGETEEKPIGVSCEKIEAQFKLILGNPAIKRNIDLCISNNDVEIVGYFIAPIATASAILTDLEKKLGCALIEFGAGVTYLSIYKNNLLKHLVTIPLGANTITKDISSLNIVDEEAENLKIKYGCALVNGKKEDNYPEKIIANDKEIDTNELNDIIEARVNEIVENIKNQLEISGFSDALGNGIIITGGGAALKNLAESIEEKIKQKVRIASVKDELVDADSSKYIQFPGIEETIGLLSLGTENCVKVVERPIVPPSAQTEITNLFGEVIPDAERTRGTRKPPVKKENKERENLFTKLARGAVKVSGNLFDSADSTGEDDDENPN